MPTILQQETICQEIGRLSSINRYPLKLITVPSYVFNFLDFSNAIWHTYLTVFLPPWLGRQSKNQEPPSNLWAACGTRGAGSIVDWQNLAGPISNLEVGLLFLVTSLGLRMANIRKAIDLLSKKHLLEIAHTLGFLGWSVLTKDGRWTPLFGQPDGWDKL